MDEPTSALDPISTSKIEDLAVELKEKYTIVMVTHDSTIVNNYKKRTIALEEGFVVADVKKGGYLK